MFRIGNMSGNRRRSSRRNKKKSDDPKEEVVKNTETNLSDCDAESTEPVDTDKLNLEIDTTKQNLDDDSSKQDCNDGGLVEVDKVSSDLDDGQIQTTTAEIQSTKDKTSNASSDNDNAVDEKIIDGDGEKKLNDESQELVTQVDQHCDDIIVEEEEGANVNTKEDGNNIDIIDEENEADEDEIGSKEESTKNDDQANDGDLDKNNTVLEDNEDNEANNSSSHEASPTDDNDEDDDVSEQEDEEWDLKHVHTIEELQNEKCKCMTKGCPLVACTIYVSSLDSTDIWHSCLDCQESDFGGWPTDLHEIPITFMTDQHREIMIEKCTGRFSPDMPHLPRFDPSSKKKKESYSLDNNASAPMTDDTIDKDESDKLKPTASITTKLKSTATAVTPPPGQNRRPSPSTMVDKPTSDLGFGKGGNKVTPIPNKKPSNQALAVHKKWQDASKALGGERIVVSKPAAKKLILDLLKDSFKPMNITDIFKRLKGVVPSPVLKSCLDDMALDTFNPDNQFADSDDEDGNGISGKKKSLSGSNDDEFAGSLSIKGGRNTNTTLYYCDYSKLSNNGNGLLPDDRNTLLSDHEVAKAELTAKEDSISSMTKESQKLLSEPTNEEAAGSLEVKENYVQELRDQVESAQELKDFEKVRVKMMKKVDVMAAQWRKRKRLCMDFLLAMEDNTDGTISVKKCLSGDGQIYIGESLSIFVPNQILFFFDDTCVF